MLTADQVRAAPPRRHAPPSLDLQFREYRLQRIDGFKNSLSRSELMALGDEAFREMEASGEGQFSLTELVMLEWVDRLIEKRLSLPSFKKWKQQVAKLRDAQRQATHWGIDPAGPVAQLLARLEPGDHALVIGPGIESCAYLLAAWDATVVFVDDDLGRVERVETRATTESLANALEALVMAPAGWLPHLERPWALCAIDLGALADADAADRLDFLERLRDASAPNAVHVLMPGGGLNPDAVRSCYPGWKEDEASKRKGRGRSGGVALAVPASA